MGKATLPKHIVQKTNKLNEMLEKADALKREIEIWAKKHGADIYGQGWEEEVIDETSTVKGIYLDSLAEYMEDLGK